ncbi:hypothetical protein LTR66_001286 [Elasticomyces elasticus]|nr:hypothetical protein LTR66_001286 [Elasticomyces elasticus]
MSPILTGRVLYQCAKTSIFTTAVAIFANDNLFEIVSISGMSMTPALSPDHNTSGTQDWIVLWKMQPTNNIKRGDIVSYLSPHDVDKIVVKRVIGLDGDTVLLDQRRRSAMPPEKQRGWDSWGGKCVVPYGHLWVEGDHWRGSLDSNHYGPIPKSLIDGRALGLVWPWSRFGQTPWTQYRSKTRVIEGIAVCPKEWEL